jgi:hypothetical protein
VYERDRPYRDLPQHLLGLARQGAAVCSEVCFAEPAATPYNPDVAIVNYYRRARLQVPQRGCPRGRSAPFRLRCLSAGSPIRCVRLSVSVYVHLSADRPAGLSSL